MSAPRHPLIISPEALDDLIDTQVFTETRYGAAPWARSRSALGTLSQRPGSRLCHAGAVSAEREPAPDASPGHPGLSRGAASHLLSHPRRDRPDCAYSACAYGCATAALARRYAVDSLPYH